MRLSTVQLGTMATQATHTGMRLRDWAANLPLDRGRTRFGRGTAGLRRVDLGGKGWISRTRTMCSSYNPHQHQL